VFRLILYSGFRTALDDWVSRRPTTNRSVSLAWQKYAWVAHHAGARCDIYVDGDLLCFFIGDDLVKTATRTGRAEIRNNGAFVPPNGLTANPEGSPRMDAAHEVANRRQSQTSCIGESARQ
jgi:hypothetical protein